MIILLSPAKKMDFNIDTSKLDASLPLFQDQSQLLINKLKKLSRKKIGQLMSLSANLSELNYNRYQSWGLPFTAKNAQQAIYSFRGDVYIGYDADTMKKNDIRFAQKHVRMLSGLHGLLKPLDLIQPYRLEMGTRLPVRRKKNLYEFWRANITQSLNEELSELNSEIVINLASNEYFKSVDQKKLKARIISCAFKENRDGEFKVIMLFVKQARGKMARYIVDNRIKDIEEIKGFNRDGYEYNESLSSENEWCFVR